MTHRDTRVLVVLVSALHSLCTAQSQQLAYPAQLRKLSRQLKCEEGICTSGYPEAEAEYDDLGLDGKPIYHCSTQYSNCHVLKRIDKSRWLQTTYGERIVIDLLQPAKVTSR